MLAHHKDQRLRVQCQMQTVLKYMVMVASGATSRMDIRGEALGRFLERHPYLVVGCYRASGC